MGGAVKAESIKIASVGLAGQEVSSSTSEEGRTILDINDWEAYVIIDENAPCLAEHEDFEDHIVEDIVTFFTASLLSRVWVKRH